MQPFRRYLLVVLTAGLLFGICDATHAGFDDGYFSLGMMFFDALLLGIFYPRRFLLSAAALAILEYAVHVVAIQYCGGRPPYVEKDVATAAYCLFDVIPAAIGGGIGAVLGWIIGVLPQLWEQK